MWHVARIEDRTVHVGFRLRCLGKETLRRPKNIWEGNIKMDVQEWIGEAWTG
jgi:hypothetical protein